MGKPTTKASHFIQELVKATFSPMVLGLRDPILREVRDGVLILFNEGHRLENLKEAIQKNPKSATTLLTREPKNENQFLISGVDSEVKDTELPVSFIQQNNIEGEPTEIKLFQKFTNGSTSTNIVEFITNSRRKRKCFSARHPVPSGRTFITALPEMSLCWTHTQTMHQSIKMLQLWWTTRRT